MEILLTFAFFVISLIVLVKGSDWFVESAEKIGLSFGISPFVIGVTIVAFGTSLPELAASIASVLDGKSEIVIGNVVGSNIANILLVLGLVAVVSKEIRMSFRVMDIDIPILVASSFLLYFIVSDQHVSIIEAIILLIGLVFFLFNSFEGDDAAPSEEALEKTNWQSYGLLILGGILVFVGAHYTIVNIEALSLYAGIPREVIAVTFVALGTSLPEVAVSITAARRGKAGMAIGNVLGSNIFNTFAVIGIPALVGTLKIPDNFIAFDLPFMIAVTILFGFMCVTNKISRWEGMFFLLLYVYFMSEAFS